MNQSNLSLLLILIVFLFLSFTPSQKIDEGFIDYELKEGNGICTSTYSLFNKITFYFRKDTIKEEAIREISTYTHTGDPIGGNLDKHFTIYYPNNQYFSWSEEEQYKDNSISKQEKKMYKGMLNPPIGKITFTKEIKMIQGFLCKKAIIEHKISDIKGQNSAIAHTKKNIKELAQFGIKDDIDFLPIPYKTEIFYTEDLPANASPFQYANIKGCILEYTHVDGLHILATYISKKPNPATLFQLPKGYTVRDLEKEINKNKKKN